VRPGTIEVARAVLTSVSAGSFPDGGQEIRIANGFDHRLVQPCALRNQAVHRTIGPLHEAIVADGDDGILHAVEQGFQLTLAGDDGGETLFDAAGSFVDGASDAADFVLGSLADARLEFTIGYASGYIDDALQTASGPIGSDGGDDQGKEEMPGRRPFPADGEPARKLLRRRKADRPGARPHRRWARRHIETECQWWHCGADLFQCGRRERTANSGRVACFSMVAGIRFGIGQHGSGGIDDGDARAGGLCLPERRYRPGSGHCDRFPRGGRELSLLNEVALNFGAQRSLPGAAKHEVKQHGGGQNDDQEGRHQLQENPVSLLLTLGASKR
jgi:hypothetical protein